MQQNKLYVGNFPFSVDEAQLRDLFSPYGEITELALITDRETGRSKGFAFITFATQQAAEKALEMDGKDLGGRNGLIWPRNAKRKAVVAADVVAVVEAAADVVAVVVSHAGK